MNSDNIYIVYNIYTGKVIDTFEFYGKDIVNLLKAGNGEFGWLNKTHSKNYDKLIHLDFSNINGDRL